MKKTITDQKIKLIEDEVLKLKQGNDNQVYSQNSKPAKNCHFHSEYEFKYSEIVSNYNSSHLLHFDDIYLYSIR